jgi:tripartite-type tricarboxylate transporter receptor subunit TctC
MPQLPDVAPLSDAPGLAGYELLNWFAMFAPATSSPPILARLAEVMPKIMARPDIKEQLAVQGIVSRSMTDAELRAFVRSESNKFAGIIQDANITLGN